MNEREYEKKERMERIAALKQKYDCPCNTLTIIRDGKYKCNNCGDIVEGFDEY